jgi:hypothetical protein
LRSSSLRTGRLSSPWDALFQPHAGLAIAADQGFQVGMLHVPDGIEAVRLELLGEFRADTVQEVDGLGPEQRFGLFC